MENRITCGTHLCQHAVIDNSKFLDVSMVRVEFDDVNMQEVSFNNINMQQVIEISAIRSANVLITDMMGAYFKLQNSE